MQCFILVVIIAAYLLCTLCSKCPDSLPDVCGQCDCNCLNNLSVSINCFNRTNVTRIPDISGFYVLSIKVVELNMSLSGPLKTISPGVFSQYSDLQVLDLHRTTIDYLPNMTTGLFQGLQNLKFLDLSSNELFAITNKTNPDIFALLISLEELRIHGTTGVYHQNGFPNDVIAAIPSLRTLWVDGRITAPFGQVFQTLENLTTIYLAGDKIYPPWSYKEFCDIGDIRSNSLQNLIHVKELKIIKCGVEDVARDAFKELKELEYLDMSYNSDLKVNTTILALGNVSQTVHTVVLNSINQARKPEACGVNITKEMALALNHTNISTIHMRKSNLMCTEQNVFGSLPKSIEHIDVSENVFQLGLYLFGVSQVTNLKTINISYTGFHHKIWELSTKIYSEINSENSFNKNREKSLFSTMFGEVGRPDSDLSREMDTCPSFISIPPGTITVYLPQNLEVVDISFSKLVTPIYEFSANASNMIHTIKATKCFFYCWGGPVHGLPNLKHLDLSWNDCMDIKTRFFSKFLALEYLDVSRNLMFSVVEQTKDGELFKHNGNLTHIDISYNHLRHIPYDFFKHQNNLRTLILNKNHLRTFNFSINHMKNLKFLDLDDNRITAVDQKVLNTLESLLKSERNDTMTISLKNSDFRCSCENLELFRLVLKSKRSKTVRIDINHCDRIGENDTAHSIATVKELEELVLHLEHVCQDFLGFIILPATLILLFLSVTIWKIIYKNRWNILYWYYVRRRKYKVNRNISKFGRQREWKYDVYVAYTTDVQTFAVEHVCKELKRQNSDIQLFLQHEDSVPGQRTLQYIGNVVNVSKITLFIITENCWKDRDWNVAYRVAQAESVYRREPTLFGIVVGKVMEHNPPDVIQEIQRQHQLLFYPERPDVIEIRGFWARCVDEVTNNIKID